MSDERWCVAWRTSKQVKLLVNLEQLEGRPGSKANLFGLAIVNVLRIIASVTEHRSRLGREAKRFNLDSTTERFPANLRHIGTYSAVL